MYTVAQGVLGEIDRLGARTGENDGMAARGIRVPVVQVHGQRLSRLVTDDLEIHQCKHAAGRSAIRCIVRLRFWRRIRRDSEVLATSVVPTDEGSLRSGRGGRDRGGTVDAAVICRRRIDGKVHKADALSPYVVREWGDDVV